MPALLQLVSSEIVRTGHVFFEQGDKGADFVIIVSGNATVCIDGTIVRPVGVGDYFGELSLLTSERRSATVAAEGETRVLQITRAKFFELGLPTKLKISKYRRCRTMTRESSFNDDRVIAKPANIKTKGDLARIVDALANVNEISTLGNTMKWQALAEIMWEEHVQAGTRVFTQGSDDRD
jgi:signal-transduction protein with cAMP-binding, CBS, and nucleotidyltransferase domain